MGTEWAQDYCNFTSIALDESRNTHCLGVLEIENYWTQKFPDACSTVLVDMIE